MAKSVKSKANTAPAKADAPAATPPTKRARRPSANVIDDAPEAKVRNTPSAGRKLAGVIISIAAQRLLAAGLRRLLRRR